MANCYHHSVSSAKHFGGKPEDYQAIHDWFDESKKIMADFRHRALRHHAEGCFACEEKFGTTIKTKIPQSHTEVVFNLINSKRIYFLY